MTTTIHTTRANAMQANLLLIETWELDCHGTPTGAELSDIRHKCRIGRYSPTPETLRARAAKLNTCLQASAWEAACELTWMSTKMHDVPDLDPFVSLSAVHAGRAAALANVILAAYVSSDVWTGCRVADRLLGVPGGTLSSYLRGLHFADFVHEDDIYDLETLKELASAYLAAESEVE